MSKKSDDLYNKKVLAICGVALVVFIIVDIVWHRKAAAPVPTIITTPESEAQAQKADATHCGLTVNSPLPGTIVTFPLTIQTVVDNTQSAKLNCSWSVFEAQAGSVTVKDTGGHIVGKGVLKTTANWMTTAATPYTATISSITHPAYTGPLQLTFTEDNAAGKPNPDTLSFVVVK
jgi:hypothetical protein